MPHTDEQKSQAPEHFHSQCLSPFFGYEQVLLPFLDQEDLYNLVAVDRTRHALSSFAKIFKYRKIKYDQPSQPVLSSEVLTSEGLELVQKLTKNSIELEEFRNQLCQEIINDLYWILIECRRNIPCFEGNMNPISISSEENYSSMRLLEALFPKRMKQFYESHGGEELVYPTLKDQKVQVLIDLCIKRHSESRATLILYSLIEKNHHYDPECLMELSEAFDQPCAAALIDQLGGIHSVTDWIQELIDILYKYLDEDNLFYFAEVSIAQLVKVSCSESGWNFVKWIGGPKQFSQWFAQFPKRIVDLIKRNRDLVSFYFYHVEVLVGALIQLLLYPKASDLLEKLGGQIDGMELMLQFIANYTVLLRHIDAKVDKFYVIRVLHQLLSAKAFGSPQEVITAVLRLTSENSFQHPYAELHKILREEAPFIQEIGGVTVFMESILEGIEKAFSPKKSLLFTWYAFKVLKKEGYDTTSIRDFTLTIKKNSGTNIKYFSNLMRDWCRGQEELPAFTSYKALILQISVGRKYLWTIQYLVPMLKCKEWKDFIDHSGEEAKRAIINFMGYAPHLLSQPHGPAFIKCLGGLEKALDTFLEVEKNLIHEAPFFFHQLCQPESLSFLEKLGIDAAEFIQDIVRSGAGCDFIVRAIQAFCSAEYATLLKNCSFRDPRSIANMFFNFRIFPFEALLSDPVCVLPQLEHSLMLTEQLLKGLMPSQELIKSLFCAPAQALIQQLDQQALPFMQTIMSVSDKVFDHHHHIPSIIGTLSSQEGRAALQQLKDPVSFMKKLLEKVQPLSDAVLVMKELFSVSGRVCLAELDQCDPTPEGIWELPVIRTLALKKLSIVEYKSLISEFDVKNVISALNFLLDLCHEPNVHIENYQAILRTLLTTEQGQLICQEWPYISWQTDCLGSVSIKTSVEFERYIVRLSLKYHPLTLDKKIERWFQQSLAILPLLGISSSPWLWAFFLGSPSCCWLAIPLSLFMTVAVFRMCTLTAAEYLFLRETFVMFGIIATLIGFLIAMHVIPSIPLFQALGLTYAGQIQIAHWIIFFVTLSLTTWAVMVFHQHIKFRLTPIETEKACIEVKDSDSSHLNIDSEAFKVEQSLLTVHPSDRQDRRVEFFNRLF